MARNILTCGLVVLLMISLSFTIGSGCANAKVIGAWLFDEGSGEIAKDSSGNGADGVITGGPEWVAGKFGNALKFEPSKYVDLPPPLSEKMILERDFTCMAWMKPSKWEGSWNGAFSMQAGSTGGEIYGIYFGDNGGTQLILWTKVNGNGVSVASARGTVKLDEWVHGAVTYDGTKMVLYQNGENVAETPLSGNLDNGDRKGRFVINGNYNSLDGGLAEWCSATIDEVLIFDEALSQDQVKAYMEKGFESGASVEPSGKPTTTWGELRAFR